MSSRTVAIQTLVKQQRTGEPIDRIFEQTLTKMPLEKSDRQLAMAIALGVIRRRNEIDFVIKNFSSTPLNKIRLEVLTALRVGIMQLLFMDRIPPSAAVNETIKGLGKQPTWLKGFMNGVLREISRNLPKAHNILTTLSKQKRTNHPGWLVDQYIKQFSKEEAFAICEANNQLPTLTLHLNTAHCSVVDYIEKLQDLNIDCKEGMYCPQAITLLSPTRIEDLPGYQEGWFHIQDEAAQLVALFFDDENDGTYLDGCAGLGGKTILLDQTLPQNAIIHAVEPHRERQSLFHENLKRCGCREIALFSEPLEAYANHSTIQYDGILIDAPCSGLGVIRRHPDIRWNRSMKDLNEFSLTQKKLLYQAAHLVKDGGFLVYITCSTSVIENEQVIDDFLSRHSNFSLEKLQPPPSLKPLCKDGYLQTLPHQGLDGFFGAKLRKNASHS